MRIKGEYKDILTRKGAVIENRGWKSNTIVPDYGKFLAALMKRDFATDVGIEYIAVGAGSKTWQTFYDRVIEFFSGNGSLIKGNGYWVWAKNIDVVDISYLKENNDITTDITNKLQILANFGENMPSNTETLSFEEFALLGRGTKSGGSTIEMFFINYVNHDNAPISKVPTMTLDRTIRLSFPIT